MHSRFALAMCLGLLGGCVLYDFDAPDPAPEEPVEDPTIPPDPPITPAAEAAALLAEWSGCMSLENFTSTNMAPTWSAISATGESCTTCHTPGTVQFPVSSNAAAFFQVLSGYKFALLQFFTVDLAQRPGKVIVQTRTFEAAGSGAPPHMEHPPFTVGAAPIAALAAFYDATVARKAAGTCDPPRVQ
jgi:hypothetical protein